MQPDMQEGQMEAQPMPNQEQYDEAQMQQMAQQQ